MVTFFSDAFSNCGKERNLFLGSFPRVCVQPTARSVDGGSSHRTPRSMEGRRPVGGRRGWVLWAVLSAVLCPLTALAGSAGSTSATVVVEPRPTVDVDGYVEWTDAVRATLRRRAPGLRNDAGTRSDVRGSGDSGSAAASASSTTTRPRVVVVPDPPRIACDERGCGGGACNRELGACRCPLSLDGARCETFAPARCDEDPASPRELVGVEYKSRCAGSATSPPPSVDAAGASRTSTREI